MTDDRDLVIRLREYRMDVDSPDVVAEAADEIERLRARESERISGMNYIRIVAYDKDGNLVGVRTIEGAEINCTYFLDDLTGVAAAVSVVIRDVDEDGHLRPRAQSAAEIAESDKIRAEIERARAQT